MVANVGVNLDPDLEAAAAPLKMNAALYIGGMGSREKNFYNAHAQRLGYVDEAKQIQDLYLGGDKQAAIEAVPTGFVDDTSLLGPVERIADTMHRLRGGRRHDAVHRARRLGTRSAPRDRPGRRRGPRPVRSRQLNYFQSGTLGVVEGLTEFLPVSSTAHLTVTEKLLDLKIDDPEVTAFTAVVQFGAIVAVLHLLPERPDPADRGRAAGDPQSGGAAATRTPSSRGYIVVGSIPIGVVGLPPRRRSRVRCATSSSSRSR